MADGFMPEYWPANRIIGKLEKALVKAENILGLIQSKQIENLVAGKITGLITSEQIAEIEAAKVSGKLTSEQIESIKSTQISGKLTNAQIESIEAAKITGVITETQIGPEAVTTPKLKAGAITTAKLAAGSVTTEILASGSVTTEKLVAGSVTAGALAAGAVTTAKLAAESITAEKIGAGQILTAKLAAGAVTAEKLTVSSLSAISANLGTVTAGTLKAVTLTALEALQLTSGSEGELGKVKASEIQWLQGETVKASIAGWRNSIAKNNQLILASTGSKNTTKITLLSSDEKAGLGSVSVLVEAAEVTILDASNKSSFLQLTESAQRKINASTVELEWPGGSPLTTIKKVNHGLGKTPIIVVPNPSQVNMASTVNYTETQFEIRMRTGDNSSPAAGTKQTVGWLAYG
jgi:hypothetical protein